MDYSRIYSLEEQREQVYKKYNRVNNLILNSSAFLMGLGTSVGLISYLSNTQDNSPNGFFVSLGGSLLFTAIGCIFVRNNERRKDKRLSQLERPIEI
jgi:hypothetical protein